MSEKKLFDYIKMNPDVGLKHAHNSVSKFNFKLSLKSLQASV